MNTVYHIIGTWTFKTTPKKGQKRMMQRRAMTTKGLKVVVEAASETIIKTHLFHSDRDSIQEALLSISDITEAELDIEEDKNYSSSRMPARSDIVLGTNVMNSEVSPSDGDDDIGEEQDWLKERTEEIINKVEEMMLDVQNRERSITSGNSRPSASISVSEDALTVEGSGTSLQSQGESKFPLFGNDSSSSVNIATFDRQSLLFLAMKQEEELQEKDRQLMENSRQLMEKERQLMEKERQSKNTARLLLNEISDLKAKLDRLRHRQRFASSSAKKTRE